MQENKFRCNLFYILFFMINCWIIFVYRYTNRTAAVDKHRKIRKHRVIKSAQCHLSEANVDSRTKNQNS